MSDHSELKMLAEMTTGCVGKYRVEKDHNGVYQVIGDGGCKVLSAWHTPDGNAKGNADFYAAANPAAVLALIAEVEGFRAQHGRDSAELRSLCQARDDARKERDSLKAELEAMRKDAERYRWLRDLSQYDWDVSYGKLEIRLETPHFDSSDLDACIDAAIRKGANP